MALQEAAFKEGGNKDVTARVLPDLNHLFVQDTDGFPGNYAKLPPPVMMRADVVTMIGDWLAQRSDDDCGARDLRSSTVC